MSTEYNGTNSNGWGRRLNIYPTQRDAFHAARAYIMRGVK